MFIVNHTYSFLYMFALWFLVKFVLEIFISLRAVVFIVLWIHLKMKHCYFKHWLKWWMMICKTCLFLDLPFRAMHKSFHLLYFWYQNLRFDLKINSNFMLSVHSFWFLFQLHSGTQNRGREEDLEPNLATFHDHCKVIV